MKRNILQSRSGLTLIEIMIAVALFTGIMVIATALFSRSIERQAESIDAKNMYEETDYVLRYLQHDLAGAQEEISGYGGCSAEESYVCSPTENELYFRDGDGVYTKYTTETTDGLTRLTVMRGDAVSYLTSPALQITAFKTVPRQVAGESAEQAGVTISIGVRPAGKPNADEVILQSSFALPLPGGFVCGDEIIDRDGFEYPTALIGSQCWFAKGVRTKSKPDGTCINGVAAPCPDASIDDNHLGRSCYDNDEENCESDGALYTWSAAMDGSTTPGAQGICPPGWHVPTDTEWFRLETGLKELTEACDPTRTKDETECLNAGDRLIQGGDSGFEGLWPGLRDNGNGFSNRDVTGYYLSSTDTGSATYFDRELVKMNPGTKRKEFAHDYSATLRCLRN